MTWRIFVCITFLVFYCSSLHAAFDDGGQHWIDDASYEFDEITVDAIDPPPYPGTHVHVVAGGLVQGFQVYNHGELTMSDGRVTDILFAYDNCKVNVGGGILDDLIESFDNAVVHITGGSTPYLSAQGQAKIRLFGNNDNIVSLNVSENAEIEIIGTDFAIDGVPVGFGQAVFSQPIAGGLSGQLTGTLKSGQPINSLCKVYSGGDAKITLSVCPKLLSDLNNDCIVNLADFAIFVSEWLACVHPDPAYCSGDAPAVCGDSLCTHSENAASCPGDCPPMCNDGYCTHGEDANNCPGDCPASCGDSFCTHSENAISCPGDCPPVCSDGYCTHSEDAASCPGDCSAVCGDSYCTHSEDAASCPGDCPAVCGDSYCTHSEDAASCPGDCPAVCGDGLCTHGEDEKSCPDDCHM